MRLHAIDVPVLLLIFRRPEISKSVVKAIKNIKPKRLFIAADGPRPLVNGEESLCHETRRSVLSEIDWECEVKTLFRNSNLGCRKAVTTAIDWFFDQVDEGIILEDDTLPSASFFGFCNDMLGLYRESPDIMHISGNNFQNGRIRGDGSYYASRLAHSWGWATWSKAWKKYQKNISGFEENWEMLSQDLDFSPSQSKWWKKMLQRTKDEEINTWDFQWHYTIMLHRGICILPQLNLVKNIGVGPDATHVFGATNATNALAHEMYQRHAPKSMEVRPEWDEFDFQHAVLNEPYPMKNPIEIFRYWNFKRNEAKARARLTDKMAIR